VLRLINITIKQNKTITINNPIQIRQGDFNVAKLVIDPSQYMADLTSIRGNISFKRADNKQSGQIVLTREGNLFTYVLKDPWLVDIAGQLWFTISFDRIINDEVQERLYAGNASLYINPDANYVVGDFIAPTSAEQIYDHIEELYEQTASKLNKDFRTYSKLDWDTVEDTDLIALNRVDSEGNVTQHYAEAKDLYNSVNGILPDEEGNIELDANDIPYGNINVGEALDNKININDDVVYYSEIEQTYEPVINVTRADYSDNDGEGNNIVETYATKQQLNVTNTNVENLQREKQDYLRVTPGLKINNSVLSLDFCELLFNGALSDMTDNTYTSPTNAPTHYLICYNDILGENGGSQIIEAGTYSMHAVDAYPVGDSLSEIRFYLTIQMDSNNIIRGNYIRQQRNVTTSGTITGTSESKPISVKLYALRLF
jgi:hypothetical protein